MAADQVPERIWDQDAQCWISDAEVAEIGYTAFAGNARHRTTARLIVRRVKDLATQDELFPVWRYHAIFTDNPHELIQAEAQHRGHAIIEQVFADLSHGPLAHLPSGSFAANAAWLACAAIAHNLARAAGCLASTFHAKTRGATLRRHLVAVPARLASACRSSFQRGPRSSHVRSQPTWGRSLPCVVATPIAASNLPTSIGWTPRPGSRRRSVWSHLMLDVPVPGDG